VDLNRGCLDLIIFPEMKEMIKVILNPGEESGPFVLADREYFIIWVIKGSVIVKELYVQLNWGNAFNVQRFVKGIDGDSVNIKAEEGLKGTAEVNLIRCGFK
jgi:hypothetical protein